ncbi:hypothetical protein [uncultured Chryseobacterium sp.]|uniref:hypothetical protein n=1 Tax=uncultured Chryseobacterium sp. TaxID=259322 RepID=UPI0025EB8523|nr:hypothetical protein [uncultured Chryseobacterium sp.]
MPDFRIVSKSFKELSKLENILREIAQKKNNEIRKDDNEYGVEFEIIQPETRSVISFSVYSKEEFTNSYDEDYGGIFQVNWSSKMPIAEIDTFMMPIIKELKGYLPDIFVESGDDYITIEEFIKINEE